jgi:hypothetical protein
LNRLFSNKLDTEINLIQISWSKGKRNDKQEKVQKKTRLLLLKRATHFWNEDTVAMNGVKN